MFLCSTTCCTHAGAPSYKLVAVEPPRSPHPTSRTCAVLLRVSGAVSCLTRLLQRRPTPRLWPSRCPPWWDSKCYKRSHASRCTTFNVYFLPICYPLTPLLRAAALLAMVRPVSALFCVGLARARVLQQLCGASVPAVAAAGDLRAAQPSMVSPMQARLRPCPEWGVCLLRAACFTYHGAALQRGRCDVLLRYACPAALAGKCSTHWHTLLERAHARCTRLHGLPLLCCAYMTGLRPILASSPPHREVPPKDPGGCMCAHSLSACTGTHGHTQAQTHASTCAQDWSCQHRGLNTNM